MTSGVRAWIALLMLAFAMVPLQFAEQANADASAPGVAQVLAEEQGDGRLGLEVRLPDGSRVTADPPPDVRVTVDGSPVVIDMIDVAGDVAGQRVLLLVDASGSMEGERLRQVRSAVQELAVAMDPATEFGLATFADEYLLVVPPTTDRLAVTEAMTSVRGGGDTALFEALETAVRTDVADRIIVLTDGQDTASTVDADDVLRRLAVDPVPIHVIALQSLGPTQGGMAQIVEASGGSSVLQPKDVAASLRTTALRIDPVLRVQTDFPWTVDLDGRVIEVVVTDADGRVISGSATVLVGDQMASPALSSREEQATPITPWWITGLLVALSFVVVFIGTLAVARLVRAMRGKAELQRVLRHYGLPETSVNSILADSGGANEESRRIIPRSWIARAQRQVESAELTMTPVAWLLLQSAVMLATLVLLILVGVPIPIAIIGLVISGALIQAAMRTRIASIRRQFNSELADFFTLVASGLRSGLSVAQAVSGAAHSGSDVLARQMRRVTAEVALGVDLADALESVATRMDSEDLALAVQALRIQREAGGALSNILDIAATTVRQRAQLGREVRALSAEGRISAIILMVLPVAIFSFFLIARREYVEVFWTEPVGWMMLTFLVVILGVGALWMQRMTRIDV
jgi:tight adherence protein B